VDFRSEILVSSVSLYKKKIHPQKVTVFLQVVQCRSKCLHDFSATMSVLFQICVCGLQSHTHGS